MLIRSRLASCVNSTVFTKQALLPDILGRCLQDIRERVIEDTARFRALQHDPEFDQGRIPPLQVTPNQVPEVLADPVWGIELDLSDDLCLRLRRGR